jgi:hypothetical protein
LRSYWMKMGTLAGVTKKRKLWAQRPPGRTPHNDGGRGWSDAPTREEMPRTVGWPEARERTTDTWSLKVSKRSQPCQHHD